MKPDIELVRRWFSYDPITGHITRKLKARSNHPDVLNPTRTRIDFMGTRYPCTHIIWVIYYGKWPDVYIDHINNNHLDNSITNLREATHAQNTRHRRAFNPNGKGVTYRGDRETRPWQAQIQFELKKMHLGFFDTSEEAAEAYKQAALKYHGEFACLE